MNFFNIYFNFWALSVSGGNPGGGGGCCFISRHKVGQAFEVDRKVGANFRRRSESVGWGSKFSRYIVILASKHAFVALYLVIYCTLTARMFKFNYCFFSINEGGGGGGCLAKTVLPTHI